MNESKTKKKYFVSNLVRSLLYWTILILILRYVSPYLGFWWAILIGSIAYFLIAIFLWEHMQIGKQQVPNWLYYTFELLLYLAFFLMLTRNWIPA